MNRRRWMPSAWTVLALLAGFAGPAGFAGTQAGDEAKAVETLAKGPVIQDVRTNRATVTWVTHSSVGTVQKEGAAETVDVEEVEYHRVELTGLEPGTRYRYKVGPKGREAEGAFMTAPAGEPPFSFVVYGDTRTRHDIHAQVVDRILKETIAFTLHAGDLVGSGLNPADWDKFFEIQRDLLRDVPMYPALGNHERNAPVYFKYFAFPGDNGHYYAFDWGSAHFAVLNSNEVGDTPQQREQFWQTQVEWLRADLLRTRKPLKFVLLHHPLFSAVQTRRASAEKIAARLEPVLVEGGVTAVFAGHDHNYQHHLSNGIHQVVTGGGGAPLYPVSPIPGVTLHAVSTENYVRVHVDGHKARIEAVALSGELIESFEVEGKPAPQPVTTP